MTDDLIGRAEAQTAIQFAAKRYTVAHEAHGEGQVVWSDNLINVTDAMNVLRDLPSAQLNHNAEVSKMGIVHCEDCEHWDTSWEAAYGLHYCPMIDMSTKKNFFCKYGAEKRGEINETD